MSSLSYLRTRRVLLQYLTGYAGTLENHWSSVEAPRAYSSLAVNILAPLILTRVWSGVLLCFLENDCTGLKSEKQCFFLLIRGHIVQIIRCPHMGGAYTLVNLVCYTMMPGLRGLERLLSVILNISMHPLLMSLRKVSQNT